MDGVGLMDIHGFTVASLKSKEIHESKTDETMQFSDQSPEC